MTLPKPDSCIGCPLYTTMGWVSEEGGGSLGILLVGEAAGEVEEAEGRPFVGPAGKLLDRLISRTKDPLGGTFSRDQFKIANVLSCRPPGNDLTGSPYEHDAIEHCVPNLMEVIERFRPKVIVALGNQPLRWLTGEWGIDHWRGSVLHSPYGWVVPTYHPAFIMRGQFQLAQVFIHDLLRAVEISRNGVPKEDLNYLEDPTLAAAEYWQETWEKAGRPPLAADIETNYSAGQDEQDLIEIAEEDTDSYSITRISFSFKGMDAISVPWTAPYISWAIWLLEHAPTLVFWNKSFDVPRLEAAGAKIRARVVDAMWQWHFLQPALPYNLQFGSSLLAGHAFQAWKHTAKDQPAWYSCRDADYTIRCFQALEAELIRSGKADTFDRHFTQFMEVLGRMSKRGVAVNLEKRAKAKATFEAQLQGIVRDVQDLVPKELRPMQVFKISKEQLEKKFGSIDGPGWIEVFQELTPKEEERLFERERKRVAKEHLKAERAKAKAAKQLAKKLDKATKKAGLWP